MPERSPTKAGVMVCGGSGVKGRAQAQRHKMRPTGARTFASLAHSVIDCPSACPYDWGMRLSILACVVVIGCKTPAEPPADKRPVDKPAEQPASQPLKAEKTATLRR